jgi:hypothetical protein
MVMTKTNGLRSLVMTATVMTLFCMDPFHDRGMAADTTDLERENAALRGRVDKLESELSQIKALLNDQGLPPPSVPPSKPPVRAGFDIELYGIIKLDASHDDSHVSTGNFARWVESEQLLENDGHFNMTANQTRLGMLIKGPPANGLKTLGQVEIDFYGAGGTENKPEPQLRLAFVKAEWPDRHLSLLAGQAQDVISPLAAPTINYSAAWWQGNIGYRRPQLRLTKTFSFNRDIHLNIEAAASRTVSDKLTSTDPDPGADAEFPTGQGRISLTLPCGPQRYATVGFSGHYGVEERHESPSTPDVDVKSWSFNLDLKLPITSKLLLQAEGFIGTNLGTYLGAISQSYNTTQADTVDAIGGWVAATFTPSSKWLFNIGAGVDNPANDDLTPNPSDPTKDPRASNVVYFGNTIYSITPYLQLALEISWLRTTYVSASDGTNFRQQFAVIYKF